MDKGKMKVAAKELRSLLKGKTRDDLVFVCIGTDRSTGDSLGPLVGSMLEKKKYHVIGTINDPTHAENLKERKQVARSTGKTIVAIDACLGQSESIGKVKVIDGPLKPGAGVKKDLGSIGDVSITGIVNVGGFMEYFVLQNTRLSLVMSMAETITEAITKAVKRPRKPRVVQCTYQEVAAVK